MFGKELPLSALLHTFPNFTLPSLPSFPIGLNCSNKYHFLHRAVILTAQSRPPPHCYPVPSEPGATMKLLHLTGSCIFWGSFFAPFLCLESSRSPGPCRCWTQVYGSVAFWVCICEDSFVQEGLLGGSQANGRGAWALWRLTLTTLGSREWGRR